MDDDLHEEMSGMQVTGEIVMTGTRSQIWALLNDEAVLARCLPGCERLTREGWFL